MTTRDELLAQHTTRWGFRARGPFEGAQQYVDAAIDFLETRDWAAAHEVRLGKRQAEWAPADVQSFQQHLIARRGTKGGPSAEPVGAVYVEAGTMPCTLDGLRELAHRATEFMMERRRQKPEGELPIFVQVLTIDGSVRVTVASGDNRLGVLMSAARAFPLYGFTLTFDAFMHSLGDSVATKRDAIISHLGTRDHHRHLLSRIYTVTGPTVTFEPETDLDIRASLTQGGQLQSFVDPYAEVFVTIPAPSRPQ